ncbi:SDR family oxidoreductase [Streptomyces alkaliterrae]|uniref:SDR family NAD(P)-dependent oxidoreductase n=1 Tax=Streptomyces alkaliterrae TaxID=2213162 RepID=A0A5P0YMV2_9ACTN|nr:SDR family oxidoreductase [Streptomyces alkaliterrae]MBB1253385.1 SDR family oxidoreductase [Streptomyces alkaliterrae]MBB1259179.1 SDR family oxidoreductase [Streptomyces alkaliterrae]MQS01591.1 SDR family NAD(P)-dependent oxidoreductase [Streptomyces alkaliterrae]
MTGSYLVTGATGRLAEAVVRLLAERGDRLLLTGRNATRLAELRKTYGGSGRVEVLEADVTEPSGAQHAAAEAARRSDGGLTGMVHLVGSFAAGPLMLTDAAEYRQVLEANFLSAVTATQAVLPHLGAGGRLVYFTSPLIHEPLAALSAYTASKAALTAWMRSVAHEVKRRGVHANAVSLTIADTPEMRRERPGIDLDHTVRPELVARAVGFLTGPESDGVYGGVIPVLGRFSFSSALSAGPPPGVFEPEVE